MASAMPRLVEGVLVASLAALGWWYGQFAERHVQPQPDKYYLSAAIGVATGRGLVQPAIEAGTPMAEFIAGTSRFLRSEDAVAVEWSRPDNAALATRYLIYPLGIAWRWFGMSWDVLGWFAGALHALTVTGTYLTIRLLMAWPFAAIGAGWMALSTLNLNLVPHFRDYSKGAFIIALMPCVIALALHARSRTALLATAAVTGIVAGIGIGFKMDVAIMVPLALMAIMVRGERPWLDWRSKLAAGGVLMLALAVSSLPVVGTMASDGSNAAHVILLGWADMFTSALGLTQPPYSVLQSYNDGHVFARVQFASASETTLAFPSAAYDASSLALFLKIAATFPADVAVRFLAAAVASTNLVFQNPDPSFFDAPLPQAAAQAAIYAAMNRLDGTGVFLAGVFVAIAAWHGLRAGVCSILIILTVGGYGFLQFGERHFFHAQIISVTIVLGVTAALVSAISKAIRTGTPRPFSAMPFRRTLVALIVPGAVAAAAVTILYGLRVHQSASLRSEIGRHVRSSLVPMRLHARRTPSGSWHVDWARSVDAPENAVRGTHYLVEFAGARPDIPVQVGIRYVGTQPDLEQSRVLSIRPAGEVNLAGFTDLTVVGASSFDGIELAPHDRDRLSAVYRVDGKGAAGLPLDLQLPAGWSELTWYQEFADDDRFTSPRVYCAGPAGCRDQLGYLAPDDQPRVDDNEITRVFEEGIVTTEAGAVAIDGIAQSESSYLFSLANFSPVDRGAVVIRGHLSRGGVSIGLLKNGLWYTQATIYEPGGFVVILPAEGGATYTPLVTNAMPSGKRRTVGRIASVRRFDGERRLP
jgi:hypothetical protein